MAWTRIRLELARSHRHPEGSSHVGYELTLPLDDAGRFLPDIFHQAPELCTVHRFLDAGEDRTGSLRHRRGGHWVFAYGGDAPLDEVVPRLAQHRFAVGEYIAVLGGDEREHTYRVVSAAAAPQLAAL